jgi:hypothetical protein
MMNTDYDHIVTTNEPVEPTGAEVFGPRSPLYREGDRCRILTTDGSVAMVEIRRRGYVLCVAVPALDLARLQ